MIKLKPNTNNANKIVVYDLLIEYYGGVQWSLVDKI